MILADVASGESVDDLFARVSRETGGRLDILVNNAGVQTWKPLVDVEESEWDRVIATNLKGCFLCTQRAARLMRDAGRGGRIINIGSGCNRIGFPRLIDDESIDDLAARLVEAEGVLLLPGSQFGHRGNNFRIGFGREDLPEALARLDAFL